MITFDFSWVTLLQFVLAIVLPLLVAIVTKRTTSGRLRGVLLASLTVVSVVLTSILNALVTGVEVELFGVLLTALISFIISVGFHFGLWGAAGPVDPATGEKKPSISATLINNVGVTNKGNVG